MYPDLARKIADLFARIASNNQALAELNRDRPAGAEPLLSAELHARGLDRFTRYRPSVLDSVRLIDWETGREIWPPPRQSMPSAFAAMAPAQDKERRAAGQRAEQQRMADYYARTTREQEERETAEARERFAASQCRNSV